MGKVDRDDMVKMLNEDFQSLMSSFQNDSKAVLEVMVKKYPFKLINEKVFLLYIFKLGFTVELIFFFYISPMLLKIRSSPILRMMKVMTLLMKMVLLKKILQFVNFRSTGSSSKFVEEPKQRQEGLPRSPSSGGEVIAELSEQIFLH